MNKVECKKLITRIYGETNAEYATIVSHEGNLVVEARYPDITRIYADAAEYDVSRAAAALGQKGRAVNSPAQQEAARANGKRGGRPESPAGSVRRAVRAAQSRGGRFGEEALEWTGDPESWGKLADAMRELAPAEAEIVSRAWGRHCDRQNPNR